MTAGVNGQRSNNAISSEYNYQMPYFEEGDRVRVDIPDEADPDHETFHGTHGTIVSMIKDNAGQLTGDDRDDVLFRVEIDENGTADFRQRDLRPPIK
jgi:ribosomal protein L21E